jgi:hypothetical protein
MPRFWQKALYCEKKSGEAITPLLLRMLVKLRNQPARVSQPASIQALTDFVMPMAKYFLLATNLFFRQAGGSIYGCKTSQAG